MPKLKNTFLLVAKTETQDPTVVTAPAAWLKNSAIRSKQSNTIACRIGRELKSCG